MMDCEREEVREMNRRGRLHVDGLVRAAALHVISEIKRTKDGMIGFWVLWHIQKCSQIRLKIE